MIRRTLLAFVGIVLALAGCKAPAENGPSTWPPTPFSKCDAIEGFSTQAGLPPKVVNIEPTHAVRADVFRCVGTTWHPIGGLGSVEITATSDAIASGVVKAPATYPWPYENLAVALPMQFPVQIMPGLSASLAARVSATLDEGDMVACWIVTRDGRLMTNSPAAYDKAIATHDMQQVTAYCTGIIEG